MNIVFWVLFGLFIWEIDRFVVGLDINKSVLKSFVGFVSICFGVVVVVGICKLKF